MKHISKFLLCLLTGIAFAACENNEDQFEPQTYDVQGKVEKGPFISGSEISIQPMDAKLQILGSMFNTAITDDLGNFVLGSKEFATPYAEFMANGYFFNEVKGQLSNGTLTLRALVDLNDNSTVNVNVLTHLKYARVKNLVESGKKFDEANKQAQKELLDAFGLGSYSNKDVSSFSIIAGTNESAALIAVSSLLLMERTEAALTEYLSKLSSDFGRNGCFSADIQTQIAADKKELAKHLNDIKEHIIERYNSLGITVNVKDLAYFIDWNNDGIAGNEMLKENQQVKLDKSHIKVPNEGGTFTVQIESPIPVYLEAQVEQDESISSYPTSDTFADGLYEGDGGSDNAISCEKELSGQILTLKVAPLQSASGKQTTISLYDYVGNTVAAIDIVQEGRTLTSSEVPLLGQNAKSLVNSIAQYITQGFMEYNIVEQYYNYNKVANTLQTYVSAGSSRINNAWSRIYTANSQLLTIQKADKEKLNVYGDYCNVLSALLYSNLVYGWGDVPYITDYGMFEQIMNEGGIKREESHNIFNDLKHKLSQAIEHLPEKKNESIGDANGFFFASKDVARVLFANILMYEGNYADAKPLLAKVIENRFYTLDASTNFLPSTTTDNVSVSESTEVIFALLNETGGTRAGITIIGAGVIPYITLSDVHLSLAECYYKLGDSDSAKAHINKVKDAKGLNVSESNVLMQIKEVREQILLYSGTYFAFLKRTGLAKDVCGIEDYQLLYPIPDQELYTNRFMTQNPGY